MGLIVLAYVESRPNSHDFGDRFDLLIAHALSCTLESEDVRDMSYEGLRFGSPDEVIKMDGLGCLNEAKTRRSWRFEGSSSGRA